MKELQTSVPIVGNKFKKVIVTFIFFISISLCFYGLTVNVINGDKLAVKLIDVYQHHVSDKIPFIKCKYKISCSEYSKNAIKEHGLRKGIILSFKRINSCM